MLICKQSRFVTYQCMAEIDNFSCFRIVIFDLQLNNHGGKSMYKCFWQMKGFMKNMPCHVSELPVFSISICDKTHRSMRHAYQKNLIHSKIADERPYENLPSHVTFILHRQSKLVAAHDRSNAVHVDYNDMMIDEPRMHGEENGILLQRKAISIVI